MSFVPRLSPPLLPAEGILRISMRLAQAIALQAAARGAA
jgi:hypothetical protein